jgi:hypothetical protein
MQHHANFSTFFILKEPCKDLTGQHCLFVKKYNEIALKIKGFIEAKIKVLHAPPQVSHPSFVDELKKLAILKEQGILSEAEFSAAKNKLLMVEHQ